MEILRNVSALILAPSVAKEIFGGNCPISKPGLHNLNLLGLSLLIQDKLLVLEDRAEAAKIIRTL